MIFKKNGDYRVPQWAQEYNELDSKEHSNMEHRPATFADPAFDFVMVFNIFVSVSSGI